MGKARIIMPFPIKLKKDLDWLFSQPHPSHFVFALIWQTSSSPFQHPRGSASSPISAASHRNTGSIEVIRERLASLRLMHDDARGTSPFSPCSPVGFGSHRDLN